jgi:hypothetical protein
MPLNLNLNTNTTRRGGLPLPVQLNPELYLSRTNGKFDKSSNGGTFVKEWWYPGLERATQTTGDYRPELQTDGVKFDGTDDSLAIDKSLLQFTDAFTIVAAIKGVSSNTNITGIIDRTINNDGFLIGVDDGDRFLFRISSGGTLYEVPIFNPGDTTSKLRIFTCTFDGANNYMSVHEDNVFKGELTSAPSSIIYTNVSDVQVGARSDRFAFFNGLVDEISMYNYALSDRQRTSINNYIKNLKKL